MDTNHSASPSNMRVDWGSWYAVLCNLYQRDRRDHRMDNTGARMYDMNGDRKPMLIAFRISPELQYCTQFMVHIIFRALLRDAHHPLRPAIFCSQP